MLVSSGNDVDKEQAALLLQLAASKDCPTNAMGLHQLLAGNCLSTIQQAPSHTTSSHTSMIDAGMSTNTNNSNSNYCHAKTSQGESNSAIPPAFQKNTTVTSITSKSKTGQFDDAPESLDSLLLPGLTSMASRSIAESIPASHTDANAHNKQQQQQQQQQHFQNTQQPSQSQGIQSQWEDAARQAHLSMIQQQQERDFYLSMAAGRPPLLNPPTSRLLQSQQYPITTTAMTTMNPTTMVSDTHPGQTTRVGETTRDIDCGQQIFRVRGKRQSQALDAIRRAKAQQQPLSIPPTYHSASSDLDQLQYPQPLVRDAGAIAQASPHEYCQLAHAPTAHTMEHEVTHLNIDSAHPMSTRLTSDDPISYSYQNGSMPSLDATLVAEKTAPVPGNMNHTMVSSNMLPFPDLSPRGTTNPTQSPRVATLLSKRAAKRSETNGKTSDSMRDLEVSHPPVEENYTWMHNLEVSHPSPLISLPATMTEKPNQAFVWTVLSDLETKRRPIPFEEVTRYDILAGRGSTTNSHQVCTIPDVLCEHEESISHNFLTFTLPPDSFSFFKLHELLLLERLILIPQGNIRFRQLGAKYKNEYLCTKKSQKRDLIGRIIRFVRQGRGRFLQRVSSSAQGRSIYYEIGDERSYAKLSQTMREGASIASLCRKIATTEEEVESIGGSSVGGTLETKLANLNQKIHLKNTRKRTMVSTAAAAAAIPPVETSPVQEVDKLEV